jgi:cytochrome P450
LGKRSAGVFHLVAHPDHVRRMLLDRTRNYPRSRLYDRAKIVLGEGLVTTKGAVWRRLRRMSQPAFHHERIAALAIGMTAAIAASPVVLTARNDTQRVLKKSLRAAPQGRPEHSAQPLATEVSGVPEPKPEACQRQG